MTNNGIIKVGLAQIAPVWLNRAETLEKIVTWIESAAVESCQLVAIRGSARARLPVLGGDEPTARNLNRNCRNRSTRIM